MFVKECCICCCVFKYANHSNEGTLSFNGYRTSALYRIEILKKMYMLSVVNFFFNFISRHSHIQKQKTQKLPEIKKKTIKGTSVVKEHLLDTLRNIDTACCE